MNSGRRCFLTVVVCGVTTALMASDSIDYGKANPPWRPGK